jgi:hypothetical protein
VSERKSKFVFVSSVDRQSFVVDSEPPFVVQGRLWEARPDLSMRGPFYDYISDADGTIAGVRFWLEASGQHDPSLLEAFSNDSRYSVCLERGYVDVVFADRNVERLRLGDLRIESVQDFGGDQIVGCGKALGIAVRLDESTKLSL